MADETTTQTGEELSWWDLDIFADSELPSTSLDEPLEWPETLDWGDSPAADGDLILPGIGEADSDPIFPPASVPDPPVAAARPEPANGADARWQPAGDDGDTTMPHVTVLAGLGGGATQARANRAPEPTSHERLPDSLWAGGGAVDDGNGVAPLVTTTMAAPTFYAEPDGGAGGWKRRFDIRHGNAAVIALISFVSLILLGMFMSVRARNQTPDTSQTRTTSDQIQVQGTLNTVPLTIPATTLTPPINIADLVPPAEGATTIPTAGTGGSTTATTAAPARSTPAAGGGGGTATTQPAAQTTNTTAAPTTAPPETTPPVTSPPVTSPPDDTTATTRPRLPTVSSTTPTNPDFTMPTLPPGFGITIPSPRSR